MASSERKQSARYLSEMYPFEQLLLILSKDLPQANKYIYKYIFADE